MIQTIITAIQQELVGALTMEQMKLLIEALYKHLPGLETGENYFHRRSGKCADE